MLDRRPTVQHTAKGVIQVPADDRRQGGAWERSLWLRLSAGYLPFVLLNGSRQTLFGQRLLAVPMHTLPFVPSDRGPTWLRRGIHSWPLLKPSITTFSPMEVRGR